MKVILAKSAGFCFGVDRAIKKAYELIDKEGIFTYGPIIHNEQVVNDLDKKGIKVINSLENIDTIKDGTIIIRSHGITENELSTIKEANLAVVNTTCPFVSRIHKIVNEKSLEGYKIIIIGNKDHPEVKGIIGWSQTEPIVLNDVESAKELQLDSASQICIVAQTTFNRNKFEEIVENVKKKVYDIIVFNTICSATHERQYEAEQIAKQVDKMIVIGGKHSSNTQKLYEICKANCEETYCIETVEYLDLITFNENDTIGITAGASTPNNIIEEVYLAMTEFSGENSFEKLLEESLVSIHSGKVVKGNVIDVNDKEVILNIGYKSEGIIPKKEFTSYPDADLTELVKVGDDLEAKVFKVNDGEGQVLLTYRRLAEEKGYKRIEEAYNNKEILTAKVVEALKSGVVVIINEARVFIPASLVSDKFERDLTPYIDKEITFQITEFNPRKRRIIGNRKILLQKERAAKQKEVLSKISVGDIVEGRVKNVTDFGAFVDLGGADGLLHISEMSFGRIVNPSELLKVNDAVKVLVKEIDVENKKIALSLKFPENNPWLNAAEKFAVGNVVTGKVARMTDFGAFVEIEPGVDALLHVSQISKDHVEKPSDVLKPGDSVTAKIVDFNEENKKISLSIKELDTQEDITEE